MAVGLGTGVPWVMCKEEDAPDPVVSTSLLHVTLILKWYSSLKQHKNLPEKLWFCLSQINTCNGFYCDAFSPNRPYKPTMWTEAWSGWFVIALLSHYSHSTFCLSDMFLFLLLSFGKPEGLMSLGVQFTKDPFKIWHLQLLGSFRKEDRLLTITWLVFCEASITLL